MSYRWKGGVFAAITVAAIVGTFLTPRFDLSPSYYDFADKRLIAGIPNFGDVVSNLALLVAGVYGIFVTLRVRRHFNDRREPAAYLVLFLGIAIAAFGSGYYHWAPDDSRLFWDRLPMTVAFMALFAAMVAERTSVRAGNFLLAPLIACGVLTIVYWYWTVQHGNPDLRPYSFVQAYSIIAVLLLLWIFPPKYSRGTDFLIAVSFYAAGKLFEIADKPVFSITGNIISGHTLKHISAAVGGYWLARMLASRKALSAPHIIAADSAISKGIRSTTRNC